MREKKYLVFLRHQIWHTKFSKGASHSLLSPSLDSSRSLTVNVNLLCKLNPLSSLTTPFSTLTHTQRTHSAGSEVLVWLGLSWLPWPPCLAGGMDWRSGQAGKWRQSATVQERDRNRDKDEENQLPSHVRTNNLFVSLLFSFFSLSIALLLLPLLPDHPDQISHSLLAFIPFLLHSLHSTHKTYTLYIS